MNLERISELRSALGSHSSGEEQKAGQSQVALVTESVAWRPITCMASHKAVTKNLGWQCARKNDADFRVCFWPILKAIQIQQMFVSLRPCAA
eukprot:1014450-Amphidinium_carterae.1